MMSRSQICILSIPYLGFQVLCFDKTKELAPSSSENVWNERWRLHMTDCTSLVLVLVLVE